MSHRRERASKSKNPSKRSQKASRKREKHSTAFIEAMRTDFTMEDFEFTHNSNYGVVPANGALRHRSQMLLDNSRGYDAYRNKWVDWLLSLEGSEQCLSGYYGRFLYLPTYRQSFERKRKNLLTVLKLVMERGDVNDRSGALKLIMFWGADLEDYGDDKERCLAETIFFDVLNEEPDFRLKCQALEYLACYCGVTCVNNITKPRYDTFWKNLLKTIHGYLEEAILGNYLEEEEEKFVSRCITIAASILSFRSGEAFRKHIASFAEDLHDFFEISDSPSILIAIAEAMCSILNVSERVKDINSTFKKPESITSKWREMILENIPSNDLHQKRWNDLEKLLESRQWIVEVPYFYTSDRLVNSPKSKAKNKKYWNSRDSHSASYAKSHWAEALWFRVMKESFGKHFSECFCTTDRLAYLTRGGRKFRTRKQRDWVNDILELGNRSLYNEKRVLKDDPVDDIEREFLISKHNLRQESDTAYPWIDKEIKGRPVNPTIKGRKK